MSIFIDFQRKTINVQPSVDLAECIAGVLLTPLRLTCGKTVEVSYGPPSTYIEKEKLHLIARIFLGALALLTFPIALAGALLCAAFSSSHNITYKQYIASQIPPPPERAPSLDELQARYYRWVQEKAGTMLPDSFLYDLMKEAMILYGAENLADHLFSPDHQANVLARIAHYLEISQSRETPFLLAHEKAPRQEKTESILNRLEDEVQECASKAIKSSYVHLTEISHLQDLVLEQINASELKDLEGLLIEQVDADLAREIMQDWDYIGTDIRDNKAVLSTERKEKILAKARLAHENQAQLQEILNQLKIDLARDLLPEERFIFQRHAALAPLLSSMPKSKIEILHQMMARALVNQELRSPTAFKGPKDERNILAAFGFSLEHYEEREKIHALVNIVLSPLLQQNHLPSVKKLKQILAETAQQARFNLAGVPQKSQAAISSIVILYQETKKAWTDLVGQRVDSLEQITSIQLPLAREFMINSMQHKNEKTILSLLAYLLKKHKKTFLSPLEEGETLQNLWQHLVFSLENQEKLLKRCLHLNQFELAIKWLTTYQSHFIHEFSQENTDEVLGDGICYALCHRLAKSAIVSPDQPIEELKIDRIMPSDRILQAAAVMHKEKDHTVFTLPPSINFRQGIREVPLFVANEKMHIVHAIVDQIGKLRQSNGGMLLSRDSHAIFLRIDDRHGQFFLFDPNFGTLSFERAPEEELEDLVGRMAICYEELYTWAYNPKTPLFATRFIPIASGERSLSSLNEEDLMQMAVYGE